MRIALVILPLLLGLAAAPALAQQGAPASSGQGEMSYKDYLMQRARLLLRMKGENPQQPQPGQDATGKDVQASSYGQGYDSRKSTGDAAKTSPPHKHAQPERPHAASPREAQPGQPPVERPMRPERPQVERPQVERPEVERPQIERPGMP